MLVEIVKENEIQKMCEMIERSIRNSDFAKFYPQKTLEEIIKNSDYQHMKQRASWTHFYVVKENKKIIGCGAIGPYWDSFTESCLFTIFVDPEYQGKGYGRKIIETLESDEFAKRANRIEVHAAMSAIPFYRKMGYEHKNGELIFEDGHFDLEKFIENKK